MASSHKCRRCGAEITPFSPPGLCARCLLQDGMLAPDEGPDEAEDLVSLPEPAPGTRIRCFGDYELLEELGHGGMGVVFKARQVSLNRVVALKLIQGGEFASPRFVQRFRTEAEAAARLQHPHVVAIHEVGEHQGQHYFSMDYVQGQTLEALVRKGPLAPNQAARLVQTMAQAIDYAHAQGVLHRDLKPSNVIVDLFDQPHITDFGLAKILTGSSGLTQSDQPLGSPGYMSPEQAAGRTAEVGVQSDVYALGSVLYYLLTGRAPFQAETLTSVLRQVLESDPVAPRLLNPSVGRDLETICLKCLEKEIHRRYGSAQELSQELGRFLEGKPILARPVGRLEKLWRWCRRQPVPASLAAALILIFTLGFSGVLWQWRQAEEARAHAERLVYAADMNLAVQAIEDFDLYEAKRYLTHHWPEAGEPDMRGWEWRYLWQRCQSQDLLTLRYHNKEANALAFSPDGRLLASGGAGRKVKILDLASGQEIRCLTNGYRWTHALAFSPDNTRLAVGGARGIRLLDTRTWSEEDAVVLTKRRTESLRFSPDGQRLIALNRDGIRCWQLEGAPQKLVLLGETKGNNPGQHAFALSSDGRFLAHENQRGTSILVRDLESGATDTIWKAGNVITRTLALSPNDQWLAFAPGLGEVEVYGFAAPAGLGHAPTEPYILDTKEAYALAFSPDGKLLAVGGVNGRLELWDTTTWRRRQTLLGHTMWITDIAFSPDTNAPVLATTSRDGTVKLWSASPRKRVDLMPFDVRPDGWDLNFVMALYLDEEKEIYMVRDFATQSRQAEHPLPYASTNIARASVSSDGKLVVFSLKDKSIRLWDPSGTDGEGVERWSIATQDLVDRVYFSSDSTLLVGWGGGRMWVWDAEEGYEIATAKNSWQRVFYLPQLTADQRQLAIPYGSKGEVCLWDFAGSGKIIRFEGRHPGCQSLALSPDESTMATVNWGGTLKMWNVASRKEIGKFEARGLPLLSVVFSPDGRRVITGSEDVIKVWDLQTGREVCNIRGDPPGAIYLCFHDTNTLLGATTKGIRRLQAPSIEEIEETVRMQNSEFRR